MRFPNDTIPAGVPPVDPTEVSPTAAVKAVRRIGDGGRGKSALVGGRDTVEEEARHVFYEREENDRRMMCRRIYHIPVMLDTRTGEDRRKEPRRPHDPMDHMDREV